MTITPGLACTHTRRPASVAFLAALRALPIVPAARRLFAVLLVASTVLGAPGQPASAQLGTAGATPPPGPILASGNLQAPGSGTNPPVTVSSWEEYAGNMILFWHPGSTLVDQAFGKPCGGTAICFAYITYNIYPGDPYNSDYWSPFRRGCTVLGADPAAVGMVGGLDRLMDDAVGPLAPAWALTSGYNGVTPFILANAAASGSVAAPTVAAWGPPMSYDQCFTNVTPTTTTMTQCNISGPWRTSQSNNYHIAFNLTQNGTSITGTASFNAEEGARGGYGGPVTATVSGTLIGNQLDIVAIPPPKPDGSRARGHYIGTVAISNGVLTVNGTLHDDAVANGPTYTWTGTGPTACVASTGPTPTPGMGMGMGMSMVMGMGGQACSWTGTWRTQQDPDLVLTQSGTMVTGTFGYHGNVSGTLAGDVLTGTITDPSGTVISLELHMNTKIDPISYTYSPAGPACAVMSGLYNRGIFARGFER